MLDRCTVSRGIFSAIRFGVELLTACRDGLMGSSVDLLFFGSPDHRASKAIVGSSKSEHDANFGTDPCSNKNSIIVLSSGNSQPQYLVVNIFALTSVFSCLSQLGKAM